MPWIRLDIQRTKQQYYTSPHPGSHPIYPIHPLVAATVLHPSEMEFLWLGRGKVITRVSCLITFLYFAQTPTHPLSNPWHVDKYLHLMESDWTYICTRRHTRVWRDVDKYLRPLSPVWQNLYICRKPYLHKHPPTHSFATCLHTKNPPTTLPCRNMTVLFSLFSGKPKKIIVSRFICTLTPFRTYRPKKTDRKKMCTHQQEGVYATEIVARDMHLFLKNACG